MPLSDPPPAPPNITPLETAELRFAARRAVVAHGLPWPSADELLASTDASGAQAHELAAALPALESSPSQPGGEPAADHWLELEAIAKAALRFVMRHPGCAQSGPPARYSAHYRRFVIELRKRYAEATDAEVAEVLALPLDTLADWMRGERRAADASAARNPDDPGAAAYDATPA